MGSKKLKVPRKGAGPFSLSLCSISSSVQVCSPLIRNGSSGLLKCQTELRHCVGAFENSHLLSEFFLKFI
ncbi:hypothetical protein AVEN_54156-1 [Araneus ventricosus]|uniref:Uncharacterized protein n=1 Tax=Araneus ventricosus TaxID=182803 RepID=A0A4Y2BUY9_ARAVE|nr:hypothetical protein AVEN_54156-1 [Araneus ventricosus]